MGLTSWNCSREHSLGMPVPNPPAKPNEGVNCGDRFPRWCLTSKVTSMLAARAGTAMRTGIAKRMSIALQTLHNTFAGPKRCLTTSSSLHVRPPGFIYVVGFAYTWCLCSLACYPYGARHQHMDLQGRVGVEHILSPDSELDLTAKHFSHFVLAE